jgi:hypothetical protein
MAELSWGAAMLVLEKCSGKFVERITKTAAITMDTRAESKRRILLPSW